MDQLQDIAQVRRIYTALTLHYVDGLTQAQVAERMGQSHSTVNRMIKAGHDMGMVEITIRSPFQDHLALERELAEVSGLREVVIETTASDNPEAVLTRVGITAAELLASKLKPGMTVCLTGGKGVSACVAGLRQVMPLRGMTAVPATGLVQGKHYTDVNHAAATLARAFGGEAVQMLSPMFAETEEQHAMITGMKTVSRVMEAARAADVALVSYSDTMCENLILEMTLASEACFRGYVGDTFLAIRMSCEIDGRLTRDLWSPSRRRPPRPRSRGRARSAGTARARTAWGCPTRGRSSTPSARCRASSGARRGRSTASTRRRAASSAWPTRRWAAGTSPAAGVASRPPPRKRVGKRRDVDTFGGRRPGGRRDRAKTPSNPGSCPFRRRPGRATIRPT